jgi:hypothetical protein
MNRLLIATAALALIGAGTALAQDTQPTPAQPAATPPITGTPEASTTTNPTGTPMPTTATGQVVGDMAATNPPPAAGSYPPCRRKGQDRCVVTAQLKHHMTTASMKRHKSRTRTGA